MLFSPWAIQSSVPSISTIDFPEMTRTVLRLSRVPGPHLIRGTVLGSTLIREAMSQRHRNPGAGVRYAQLTLTCLVHAA